MVVIQGSDTANFDFWDEDRKRQVSVTLPISEGIKLKLLDRIAKELRRINGI